MVEKKTKGYNEDGTIALSPMHEVQRVIKKRTNKWHNIVASWDYGGSGPGPLSTPATAASSRGHWELPPDFYYRGHSQPGRKAFETDKRWEQFGAVKTFDTNSMAALMEFNLFRLLKRMEKQLIAVSPGSVAGQYKVDVGRQGATVYVSLSNNHPAWGYLMAGTATHRIYNWKQKNVQTSRTYPIIPIRGPWAIHKPGYITPEDRDQRINEFKNILAQYREEREMGDFDSDDDENPFSEAKKWMKYALKLQGNWVAPMDNPTGPSVMEVIGGEKDLIPDRPPFVNKKGEVIPRKKNNSRGEIYVNYLEHHPGIKAHKAMYRTMLKWGNPENIRALMSKEASKMVKEAAAMILAGRNVLNIKGEDTGVKQKITLQTAHANISVFQRFQNTPGFDAAIQSFKDSEGRRNKWSK